MSRVLVQFILKLPKTTLKGDIMKELNMKFTGKIIKKLREQAGESQEQLAVALNVPNRETITRWENGSRDLKREHIIAIARHFNVSSDYLLGLSDISSTNEDIKIACNVTGLSEKSIDVLIAARKHPSLWNVETVNLILESEYDFISLYDLPLVEVRKRAEESKCRDIISYEQKIRGVLSLIENYITLSDTSSRNFYITKDGKLSVNDFNKNDDIISTLKYLSQVSNINENEIKSQIFLNEICSKLKEIKDKFLKEREENAEHNPTSE